MSDFKDSTSARMLRTLSACLVLGLMATMVAADGTVTTALHQAQSPEELADVLNDAGLFEAPLARRSVLCLADHLPTLDVNRLLMQLQWPGPYFEGQGVGTAKLTTAPRMPWRQLGDAEASPPVAVRFAVNDQGRVRGIRAEGAASEDVMAVIRKGLARWQFESAQVLGQPGTVCRRQVLVPPGSSQDPDAPPAITPDMVQAVSSADELVTMLAETGAAQAPARVRAALCWLPSELRSAELTQQLFVMGWPGPYPGRTGSQQPKKIEGPEPQYTEATRKERIMGVVIVRYVVDARGRTEAFHVLESVHPGLSEATIQAIRKSRYTPAQIYGRPVSSCFNKTVNYRLQ